MKAAAVFAQIKNNEITEEQFKKMLDCHEAAVLAEQELKLKNAIARYENANAMAKSYMEEFAKQGLAYKELSVSESIFRQTTPMIKSVFDNKYLHYKS